MARCLVADLDEFQRAIRLADVLQLVPVPAARAKEMAAEVINGRLDLGKLQICSASPASPHGAPPCKKGILS